MSAELRTIVTKGAYARLKGRTPQAVSNWIATGKISPAALIGEGYAARVWVERADAELAGSLDPAQQSAQTLPLQLNTVAASPADLPPRDNAAAAFDDDLRRRRKADADKAEFDAESARRRLAVDQGRWIDAAVAAQAMGKIASTMMATMEVWLADLAETLRPHSTLAVRDVLHLLRSEFRKLRDNAERRCAAAAAEMPDAVEEAEERSSTMGEGSEGAP